MPVKYGPTATRFRSRFLGHSARPARQASQASQSQSAGQRTAARHRSFTSNGFFIFTCNTLSSCNNTTPPPTKQFSPWVRAQPTRPTPTKATRNSPPAHTHLQHCRGKLALAVVTPPQTSTAPPPTPTTTTTAAITTSKPASCSTADSPTTTASAANNDRRRQPLAIRHDAANKMRNLHTSRSSPFPNNNTNNSNKHPSAAAAAASSSNPRMPYDRNNPTAPTSRQQPHVPSLAKRTPVTPKLAAKTTNPSKPTQRQTVTLAAPVPRKSTRPESVVSQSTASNLGGIGSRNRVSVTPRQYDSNRQSRTSSATTSPSPADGSADSWESRSGLSTAAPSSDGRNTPVANSRDSKFFYASDAPKGAQPPTSAPRPTPALAKGPTFFYANGSNLPPKGSPTSSSPAPFSPPLNAPTSDSLTSDSLAGKFMYASGTPDLRPNPTTASGSASVTSTSSKRISASKGGSNPQSPAFLAPRAPSPGKVASYPAPPTPTAPGPSIAERRSVLGSTPHLSNASLRRISTESPPRVASSHSRSGSLVAEPPSVNRTVTASPPVVSPLHSPLAFSTQGGLSMASVLQAAEEASEIMDHDDNESITSGLASPKSSKGDDPLSDLVANARRERKVQDLQITNASLEAINRTLERQLRKQTNELRRFKRLSRAGRLSSANTMTSSRTVSDSTMSETPEGPLNDLSLSDLSEEGEDDQEDEDLESELSESESSGSACPSPDSTTAARDEKYRKRDEKRLQIDLSKHQQLLVDSQKMNQSLKRCLGWTEELINEGRRALAYEVRVSEVDVGGCVAREDGEKPFIYDGATLWDHHQDEDNSMMMGHEDELSEDDDGKSSDLDETMRLRIERLRPADENDGNKSTQDRDSGIVLPGDAA